MKLLKYFLVSIALMAAHTIQAAPIDNPEIPFKKLQGLVGVWKLSGAKSPAQRSFRISYRLISGNSALVETFGDPAGQVTETIYHLDGKHLMATHYCAQGNQPRLRLKKSGAEEDTLMFEYFDATNLKSAGAARLVRMRFKFIDARHFTREEVYAESGQEEASTLTLERDR